MLFRRQNSLCSLFCGGGLSMRLRADSIWFERNAYSDA